MLINCSFYGVNHPTLHTYLTTEQVGIVVTLLRLIWYIHSPTSLSLILSRHVSYEILHHFLSPSSQIPE